MVPLRLTRRPGRASTRVRTVRATVQLIVGMDVAQTGTPADEVVGQHRAGEPCRVGEEAPRGTVLEARSFLQVADGQLDRGVLAVERVHLDERQIEVGDEGVMTPIGPQRSLGALGEAGAAHDQAHGALLAVHAGV